MRPPRQRAVTRLGAVVATALGLLLLAAAPAGAHPLGNFTVNTYSALTVEPSAVRVDVVVDRAEIPTRQSFPDLDDRTGELPGGSADPAAQQCADAAAQVRLAVDGRPTRLTVDRSALVFPPGVAGLRTARLSCALRAELTADPATADPATGDDPTGDLVGSRVDYAVADLAGATGWHEVTAAGDGVALDGSDVPERSISDALRSYPEDRLDTPLDVRAAGFSVSEGSGLVTGIGQLLDAGPVSAIARGADRWSASFTDLVARDTLTAPFLALAAGTALLLGGLHAFAPGHGKTVMAAYLVGQRSSLRDAFVIGASVTVTHTLGVLVLGVVLTAVGLSTPERIYPWLGLASGLLLVGIGAALLHSARHRARTCPPVPVPLAELVPAHAGRVATVTAPPAPHHDHDHDHPHHDHDHEDRHHDDHPASAPHSHGLFRHTHAPAPRGSGVRGLLAVGFAGGMVPSPSALVVLLGGIALGRAWLGVVLVVLYGVGMALALVLTGVLLVTARDRIDSALRRSSAPRGLLVATRASRVLPLLTSGLVILVGAGLVLRALTQL